MSHRRLSDEFHEKGKFEESHRESTQKRQRQVGGSECLHDLREKISKQVSVKFIDAYHKKELNLITISIKLSSQKYSVKGEKS